MKLSKELIITDGSYSIFRQRLSKAGTMNSKQQSESIVLTIQVTILKPLTEDKMNQVTL